MYLQRCVMGMEHNVNDGPWTWQRVINGSAHKVYPKDKTAVPELVKVTLNDAGKADPTTFTELAPLSTVYGRATWTWTWKYYK